MIWSTLSIIILMLWGAFIGFVLTVATMQSAGGGCFPFTMTHQMNAEGTWDRRPWQRFARGAGLDIKTCVPFYPVTTPNDEPPPAATPKTEA